MSDHAVLETMCPNNHNITLDFTQHEFEASLKSGSLVFHCNTCDANWPPTSDDIAEVPKQFQAEVG